MITGFADLPARFVPNEVWVGQDYPAEFRATLSQAAGAEAMRQISGWQGYAPTPLIALAPLAAELGIGALSYKQEAGRFGLGSFKALGGAYAVYRLLCREIAAASGAAPDTAAILSGRHADLIGAVTVCCATDGNHGRSVAWGARMFGCQAVIFLHATVSAEREAAIAGLGARVVRTAGTYDDSVREAARMAAANGWTVVSDTSYPGYTEIPREVMQGYSVMAQEARQQIGAAPTHIFVQGGVGGLAAAVTAEFWEALGPDAPRVVVVEPETAACLLESAAAGVLTSVGGDLDTIMAGLACGEPSVIAWPILQAGAVAFMAICDEAVAATMRLLASGTAGPALVGGESGVAGLAGLLVLAGHADWRARIGLDATSRVLVFGSEGDTAPSIYRAIVGASAAEVLARAAAAPAAKA